jgi:hypothetical protein
MTYECSCYGDAPQIHSERSIKRSRIPKKCCECAFDIAPGDPCHYDFMITDGWASSYHTCQFCWELYEWARISAPCFCYAVGGGLHAEIEQLVEGLRREIPGFFFEYGRRAVRSKRSKEALLAQRRAA